MPRVMTLVSCPLDIDILLEVFEIVRRWDPEMRHYIRLMNSQLRSTSPNSLLNVALTCRTFNSLSKAFLYRSVHFIFNRNRRVINGRLIRQLLEDAHLSAKVRCVRIDWAPSAKLAPGEGSKEDLIHFAHTLPKLNRLDRFIWDAQYPIIPWFLDTLRTSQPKCQLYIRQPPCQNAARSLAHLQNLQCLRALDIGFYSGQFQAYNEFAKVLTSSTMSHLAVTAAADNTFMLGSNLPNPLTLTSLETRGFITDPHGFVALPQLIRLAMHTDNALLVKLPPLDGLKTLELQLDNSAGRQNLPQMLQSCRRLETLELTIDRSLHHGRGSVVREWKRSQWTDLGKTLIKLKLHETRALDEEHSQYTVKTELPYTTLEFIATECPKLRSLGIDLNYSGKWVCLYLIFFVKTH